MADTAPWEEEIANNNRFAFGENWAEFLGLVDESRIERAGKSLRDMLELDRLDGLSFLDIGSGSGLFSLAARRLGAKVTSFDYDPQSVSCTDELRRRYFPEDKQWRVCAGSVLDCDFLETLGTFDIVYSWGVLHHTGSMWTALGNAARLVAPKGRLYVAIYNDQGRWSRMWGFVKRSYVRAPGPLKWLVVLPAFVRLWGPTTIRDLLKGHPFRTWRLYQDETARGMDPWRDVVDWVGGYPFEVAKPEEIFDFYRKQGFELRRLTTCGGGIGCNEFVFAAR